MIKAMFIPNPAMDILKDLIYQNQYIPDIINKRVLGRVGYAVRSSQKSNYMDRIRDRASFQKLSGQALGFKKRMFSSKHGLAGHEGMLYNVSARKNFVKIYLVKDDLWTREQAIQYKSTEMTRIMNSSKGQWQNAAEKAINDTFKMIGWK